MAASGATTTTTTTTGGGVATGGTIEAGEQTIPGLPGVYLTAPASGRQLAPFVPSPGTGTGTGATHPSTSLLPPTSTNNSNINDNDNDNEKDNGDYYDEDDTSRAIGDVNQLEFDIATLERAVKHLLRSNEELREALVDAPNDPVSGLLTCIAALIWGCLSDPPIGMVWVIDCWLY
jgi:hypothetical protein